MTVSKSLIFCLVAVSTLTLQSCAMTRVAPDPDARQLTLERWNRCLERFPARPLQHCDGHRRDIISLYPGYMEEQLNAQLSRQAHSTRAQLMVKTGLRGSAIQEKLIALDNFIAGGDNARNSDL